MGFAGQATIQPAQLVVPLNPTRESWEFDTDTNANPTVQAQTNGVANTEATQAARIYKPTGLVNIAAGGGYTIPEDKTLAIQNMHFWVNFGAANAILFRLRLGGVAGTILHMHDLRGAAAGVQSQFLEVGFEIAGNQTIFFTTSCTAALANYTWEIVGYEY